MNLGATYREWWKRPGIQEAVREFGLCGTQSIHVVKQLAKILEESEWYRKKCWSESMETIKPALLIEECTEDAIGEAHAHAMSKLRTIMPSMFLMGMITGYIAARNEILDSRADLRQDGDGG